MVMAASPFIFGWTVTGNVGLQLKLVQVRHFRRIRSFRCRQRQSDPLRPGWADDAHCEIPAVLLLGLRDRLLNIIRVTRQAVPGLQNNVAVMQSGAVSRRFRRHRRDFDARGVSSEAQPAARTGREGRET